MAARHARGYPTWPRKVWPRERANELSWKREGHNLSLLVESGFDRHHGRRAEVRKNNREALIAWTPNTDQIRVGPLLGRVIPTGPCTLSNTFPRAEQGSPFYGDARMRHFAI